MDAIYVWEKIRNFYNFVIYRPRSNVFEFENWPGLKTIFSRRS